MLINLNEEKEEDVVDDKEKEEVNSATYVLFLFECLSCVCLILIIIIFLSFLFFVCVFILSVRFKSVNSAHFYYTLIVVTGVETDILRNQTWYAVSQWLNE